MVSRMSDKSRMSKARSNIGERKPRTLCQATLRHREKAIDSKGLAPGVELAAGVLKPVDDWQG